MTIYVRNWKGKGGDANRMSKKGRELVARRVKERIFANGLEIRLDAASATTTNTARVEKGE